MSIQAETRSVAGERINMQKRRPGAELSAGGQGALPLDFTRM